MRLNTCIEMVGGSRRSKHGRKNRPRDLENSLMDWTEPGTTTTAHSVAGDASSGVVHRFGKSLDSSPCLVLNADYSPLSYTPLSVWNWRDSLRAVLANKATIVSNYNLEIRSVSVSFLVPSVICLKKFQRYPATAQPPVNRRNIYIRDAYQCQYCLGRFSAKDLTLDHVHPRSKGGKGTWENLCSACSSCNTLKANRSVNKDLPRLGMRIKKMPQAPSFYELQARAREYQKKGAHPHWDAFL